jgi:hypothetical protein
MLPDTGQSPDKGQPPDKGQQPDKAVVDPLAGKVKCESTQCTLPAQVCCVSSPLLGGKSTFKCKPPANCKAGIFGATIQAPQACDGPEDCTKASPICCAIMDMLKPANSGAKCVSSCAANKWQGILCHTDKDCTGIRKCTGCKPPGGYTVKMCVDNGKCPY